MHPQRRPEIDNRKMSFLGNQSRVPWKNDHPPWNSPPRSQNQKFFANVRFPKTRKQIQRYIGFINYYRNYVPQLSEKLRQFYELLKIETQLTITEELLDDYKAINTALADACGLALKQPITGRQYVIMADARFRTSGYALMIEEQDEKKLTSRKKTFAPVAFGSKVFSQHNSKCPYTARNS